jgi:hypothetical protein
MNLTTITCEHCGNAKLTIIFSEEQIWGICLECGVPLEITEDFKMVFSNKKMKEEIEQDAERDEKCEKTFK